jgi:hypothetical protein
VRRRPSSILSLTLAATFVLPAAGCLDREITRVDPSQDKTENLVFTAEINRKLDILFVVDDSNSMEREQLEITENFRRMIDVLETIPGGLPDLHIGVITTNVGAGDACPTPSYGPGVLRDRGATDCPMLTTNYIEDIDGAGGRTRNYTGTLDDAFACVGEQGIGGCGFEQPLEAIRLALSPGNTSNEGFLRDDATLAVVILSDEDDCSAMPSLFADDPDLGPRANFRCFEYGIECDGPPEQFGIRENCVPRSDSPYLTPLGEYVTFLRGLKPLDSRLIVAGILGDAGPIRVGTVTASNGTMHTDVLRSCDIGDNDPQGAFPPIRTDALLSQIPGSVRTGICDEDLSTAMEEVADAIRKVLLGACFEGIPIDHNTELAGIQADCSVTEIQHVGTPEQIKTILPQCGPTNPADNPTKPCWTVEEDAVLCETFPTQLKVMAHYPTDVVREPDTVLDVQCQTN